MRRFDQIRARQFPHGRGFRRFLRTSGETVANLLLRVRLNMLSAAIQHHVMETASGEPAQAQALAAFIHGFDARWRSQTRCAPAFAMADCGHVGAL